MRLTQSQLRSIIRDTALHQAMGQLEKMASELGKAAMNPDVKYKDRDVLDDIVRAVNDLKWDINLQLRQMGMRRQRRSDKKGTR